MRTLHLTLAEIDPDKRTCHRAERVITAEELRYCWEVPSLLARVFEDLEKILNEEIKKHE